VAAVFTTALLLHTVHLKHSIQLHSARVGVNLLLREHAPYRTVDSYIL